MTDEAWLSQEREAAEDEVAFDYIKSPQFRVTWIDGAMAAMTPAGNIHVTFYAERPAIPRRQVFKFDEETHSLGEEVLIKRISRESIVREMSVDAMMSMDTARSLGEFLIKLSDDMKQLGEEE